MLINIQMIFIFALISNFLILTKCQNPIQYIPRCSSSQYLSSTDMTCISCPANSVQSSNAYSKGLSCVCAANSIYTKNGGGAEITCTPCPNNFYPSPDGWSCILCAQSSCTGCGNNNDQILSSTDITGAQTNTTCKQCAQRYLSTNNQCQFCLNKLNTGQGTCTCPSGYYATPTACINNINSYGVEYSAPATFASLNYNGAILSGYVSLNILDNFALCIANIDSGCQSLANMCVMDMYNVPNYRVPRGGPCSFYGVMDSRRGPLFTKKNGFPWLYYSESLTSPNQQIQHQYRRGESIQIMLAAYDISGQFLGLRNATDTYNLQLCTNTAVNRAETFRFGTNYIETCSIPISQLANQSLFQPIFYDPYIVYNDGTTVQLYPIPIRINNVPVFVRRLLLVDNVGSVSVEFSTNKTAQFVRYASSMRLSVIKISSNSFNIANDGKILQPILEVNFTTISTSTVNAMGDVSFEVMYYNDSDYTSGFRYSISVAMGVMCALAGLYAILRSFFWCRRSGITGFEGLVLLKLLAYACASISNVFFLVIFGVSLYFLLLYKNQTLFTIIPPDDDTFFVAYLISAFLLKLLEIVHIFITQCTVDIFLIDWERPKHLLAPKPVIERSKFDYTDSNGDQTAPPKDKIQHCTSVSIWRSYFIANEWNEIQTYRKTSLVFNLMIVILFMEVIGFGNITRFDPFVIYQPNQNAYAAPYYRMFRFSVIVSIFAITGFLQWLFTILIYERLIKDTLRNYVDLCSVSNVSVFILAHRQFGYYIHGRSVHGTADVSLAEMYVALQKENAGSCAKRGLESDSMQQTYIMALPNNFRDGLDAIYRPIGTRLAEESRTLQYLEVNKFLDRFINRTNLPRITFRYEDRKFFEDVFDGEFEDNSIEGRFYRDNGTSFGNILFYGQELSLITFDILLFCVVDLILKNTVFDAFITWGLVTILKLIRNACGAHNLANKTLVDHRFLI